MDGPDTLLVTITGPDQPGVTSAFTQVLASHDAVILDMEQVVVRRRLILCLVVSMSDQPHVRAALQQTAVRLGLDADVEALATDEPRTAHTRHHVTVLTQTLTGEAMAGITGRITDCGANIERIDRLSRYPIASFELLVAGGDPQRLRHELTVEAATQRVDVAIQRASLYRRAKRLICMDVDSTLIQGEVIELLAAQAGCLDEVSTLTERAMAGELDFEAALRERVRLLAGLPVAAAEVVRDHLVLTPGARTLVRTLDRLGFAIAIVSGGFTIFTDDLKARLGLDYAAANTLEIVDGHLTGELIGPVVDRARKAELLERFAVQADVPLSQTVAVGDGANDLDMLARAGLGIAFNAKPLVREAADTAVTVPYLDAILFLLGITREEVEAADAEDLPSEPAPAAGE